MFNAHQAYVAEMGLGSVLGTPDPRPHPLFALLPGSWCRLLSCMQCIPGSLAFWLLVGFGHWGALQERRRKREESGVGNLFLYFSYWDMAIICPSAKVIAPLRQPSLHCSLPLPSSNYAPYPFRTGQPRPAVTGPELLLCSWWFSSSANTFVKKLFS